MAGVKGYSVCSLPGYLQTVANRVWPRIDRSGTPEACWPWTGPIVGIGYGKVGAFGKTQRAHRLVWILVNGPIPDGMFVCHSCDYPACCNPSHLFLGSPTENVHDMVAKGRDRQNTNSELRPRGDTHYARTQPERLARGEQHGNAKVTAEMVRQIRARYSEMPGQTRVLAAEFGISRNQLRAIAKGQSWAHLTDSGSDQ